MAFVQRRTGALLLVEKRSRRNKVLSVTVRTRHSHARIKCLFMDSNMKCICLEQFSTSGKILVKGTVRAHSLSDPL